MEYEVGGCSVVDPVCLLFESLCIESFDSNSEFKGGEFKFANHRVSVFSSVSPRFPSFCLYYIRKAEISQMCENVAGSSP